jgi:hypothetical protein
LLLTVCISYSKRELSAGTGRSRNRRRDFPMHGAVERIGHELPCRYGGANRARCREQHRIGKSWRTRAHGARKQSWKGQNVINALAVGCYRGTRFKGQRRLDFRIGIRQREYDLSTLDAGSWNESLRASRSDHNVCAAQNLIKSDTLSADLSEPSGRLRAQIGPNDALHAESAQQLSNSKPRGA